ncbi:MAG: two-component system response regulator [Bacteroidetes bacterium GWC2_33_15]|nr:MAG: two-component system response regulator [Bacteroidetes bacterium GWA2_33_15]OFX52280.1 MAG: two-component system response regulator [Bacteroidetes bacterium GWC2_33_15]OFX64434.1 MAG: two-component system response regulator [Bacteroidetes bacterium GWB2_32_14]OFX67839.1 MAG: two-component system response regulator [Bacteroidetes bacterium GWD2_33_33]HAN19457.1 two-component system response regulator [Bacteroidales bacterium]
MEHLNEIEILLVEDNPNDAELTIRALKKNNLANNIIHVTDGEEALSLIHNCLKNNVSHSLPKIILLDLKLPKVDGLEVLKELKSNDKTKVIPVIMLTSSKEERDIIESYKLGVNSYITKPVDFDQFVEAIKNFGLYWLLLNQSPII